jgi:phosphohistidine phosphatase
MGENDDLRPLTEEGIAAMKREARYVGDMKLKLDAIVTSPLVRARETARIVAKAFGLKAQENDLLRPGFNLDALEKLLAQYPDATRLMVVGHEPDFSGVIGQLIGSASVVMRKGGLARVDLTGALRGELVWLLTPQLLGA